MRNKKQTKNEVNYKKNRNHIMLKYDVILDFGVHSFFTLYNIL